MHFKSNNEMFYYCTVHSVQCTVHTKYRRDFLAGIRIAHAYRARPYPDMASPNLLF